MFSCKNINSIDYPPLKRLMNLRCNRQYEEIEIKKNFTWIIPIFIFLIIALLLVQRR